MNARDQRQRSGCARKPKGPAQRGPDSPRHGEAVATCWAPYATAMARRINYAKDGAEPMPWSDYILHLSLLVGAALLVVLRLLGAVSWSWWVVLIPLWLLFAVWVASYLMALAEYRRQQAR